MKILDLKGNATPSEGYYVFNHHDMDSFRSGGLTPEHLIALANDYKDQEFDAIGVWEDAGITYVDALVYTDTCNPNFGYYAYDITTGKHFTIPTN